VYGRLFDTIFDSSIMEEEFHTRLLWHYMIVLSDEDGVVDMTIPALARRTNIGAELVSVGIERLAAPDPSSRSPELEGRRIVPLEGQPYGWRLVNHAKYRDMKNAYDRREYFRGYRRKRRAEGKDLAVHSEQDEQDLNTPEPSVGVGVSVGVNGFESFWQEYPRKVGKRDAAKAWKQTAGERPPLAELLAALASLAKCRQWTRDGGQYAPYPATWLRRGGWEDDAVALNRGGGNTNRQTADASDLADLQAKVRRYDPEAPDA
jgi:hypothetical protein